MNPIIALYNFFLLILSPVAILLSVIPGCLDKKRILWGYRQRLRAFPSVSASSHSGGKRFWIHAASVGEVKIAKALASGIRRRFPASEIFLSTFTDTGFREAEKTPDLAGISLAPLDLPFCVRPVLQRLKPHIFLPIEAEFWPNLYHETKKSGVPLVLVNGRISGKAFRNYRKFPFLFREVLGCLDAACMRSEIDADRIRALGVPVEKVKITGNIKFNAALMEREELRRAPSTPLFSSTHKVFILGNTRDGEEVLLIPAMKKLLEAPDTVFILAPRHLRRIGEVADLLKKEGMPSVSWSTWEMEREKLTERVILLDRMGKLFPLYETCVAAFVGGSLLPFGGQNILEPAAFGKPVFFGPHMKNFEEEARILRENGGGTQVADAEELGARWLSLLQNPEEAEKMGAAAREGVVKGSDALERCLDEIENSIRHRGLRE